MNNIYLLILIAFPIVAVAVLHKMPTILIPVRRFFRRGYWGILIGSKRIQAWMRRVIGVTPFIRPLYSATVLHGKRLIALENDVQKLNDVLLQLQQIVVMNCCQINALAKAIDIMTTPQKMPRKKSKAKEPARAKSKRR